MAKIIWALEAVRWLEDIHNYIALDAHKVVTGIYDKIQLLCSHPRLGQRYEPVTDREVREIHHGHYRIADLIKTEGRVEILGVFHCAMEIERYHK